jgi:hypothetical protein
MDSAAEIVIISDVYPDQGGQAIVTYSLAAADEDGGVSVSYTVEYCSSV